MKNYASNPRDSASKYRTQETAHLSSQKLRNSNSREEFRTYPPISYSPKNQRVIMAPATKIRDARVSFDASFEEDLGNSIDESFGKSPIKAKGIKVFYFWYKESASPVYAGKSELFEESSTDLKLMTKELSMYSFIDSSWFNRTKKSLNETQARAISATKELSRIQHENSILQMQIKRTEVYLVR